MADLEGRVRARGRTALIAVGLVALAASVVGLLAAAVSSDEDEGGRLAATGSERSTPTVVQSSITTPIPPTDVPTTAVASAVPRRARASGEATPSVATTMPPSTTSTTTSSARPLIADPCGRASEPSARAASRSPEGRIWVALDHGAIGTSDDRARTWTWACDALRIGEGPVSAPVGLSARTTTAAWAVVQPKDRPGKVLLETGDGGRTWRTSDLDLDDVGGVAAIDDADGIAWGRRDGVPALLHWSQANGWSGPATGVPGPIARAVFVTALDGWVVGTRTDNGTGFVLATADGGTTWRDLTPTGAGPVADAARGSGGFGCVLLPGELSCSTDGGATWTTTATADGRTSRVGIYRGNTVLLAMAAGQVRWYGPDGLRSGQTITDTDGQVRAFAVEWGRSVVINSDDGWIDIESILRETGLEWYSLWQPRARR